MHSILLIFLLSFVVSVAIMPRAITLLRCCQKYGQPIRADGPSSHLVNKKNTPTMGGIVMIACIVLFSLIFCAFKSVSILILCMLGYALLGFWDDYLKILKNNSVGVKARKKLLLQFCIGIFISVCMYVKNPDIANMYIPLYGLFNFSYFFIPLATLVIVGMSNALNLTDGLDGLAISQFLVSIIFVFTMIFLNKYSWVDTIISNNVSIVCVIAAGSALAFLCFNSFPAKIFMGDVGALGLGALLACIFLALRIPFLLLFSAIIPALEAISVILQVYYFKFSGGKRLFLMAPMHHHFEKKHFHECSITMAMLVAAIISNIIAATL